ncbi:Prohead protease [uncultured Caudovirales phage]|uniref:Prohead protease n=1 Tax=uncultured Caudovirales phage TaxID=2100421 RepID=A0A6J5N940_9CAUD|nr:Prohead protease [uncultured Caudovirales phage]
MENIETRSFEIRESDLEQREVIGRAVPYNDTIDIGGGSSERFVPGSVDLNSHVKLFRDHKDIIGKVQQMEEREDGLWIRAKISSTKLGDETLALVKDGAINSFSVGFVPLVDEKQDRTIIRKKVKLKEVSLVAFPAYENASVTEVREIKEETMENTTTTPDYTTAITEVRNHAEELERRLDVLTADKTAVASAPQFRSYGEYVKAVAAGDVEAHRAFADTSGVLADTILKNAWVNDTIRILNNGRPTYNVFSSAPLPSDGMTIEYPLLNSDTTSIEEQEAEGDTLAFGKIDLTSATAPIKTYGGYTAMTRQLIERSSVAYVDAAFRAMAATYAKKTNNLAKAALGAANASTSSVAAWSADAIIEMLADSATKVNNETGKALEFILCSSDVFKQLAKQIDSTGRPIAAATNPTNGFGSINPVGLTGSIAGLPIVVDPSLANGSLYTGASSALTTYESAGAPFRLNDGDITNLTQQFSVYGYLAIAAQDPKAIVRVANPLD